MVGMRAIDMATGTVLLYTYECFPLWLWHTSQCGM